MSTMTPHQVTDLVVTTLERCRTSRTNAQAVARALLGAELAGQAGHGLRRMPSYCAQALSGKVDGMAEPSAHEMRPGALRIDAANGFAYPAIEKALDWLPKAAKANGIAMAGIHRSHHCGVAGLTVEALAQKGLIGLLFANAPAAIAPWGGKKPLFGTDPIAFAAPLADGEPVVVDISLSKVARGKIMAAEQQGKPIPEGWALDADGNPTTDPSAAMKGTMVPMATPRARLSRSWWSFFAQASLAPTMAMKPLHSSMRRVQHPERARSSSPSTRLPLAIMRWRVSPCLPKP